MSRAEHGRDDRHGADVDQLLDTLVFVVEERVRNRIACDLEERADKTIPPGAAGWVRDVATMIRRGECG